MKTTPTQESPAGAAGARRRPGSRRFGCARRGTPGSGLAGIAAASLVMVASACGFGVSLDESGYASRWDASPSKLRSLAGGLTYNVGNFFGQSGYANFANQFVFSDGSDAEDVQLAVELAFGTWTAVDPATGLGAGFSFTSDVGGAFSPFSTTAGAEIDIVAFDRGDAGTTGFTERSVSGTVSTLTSGFAAGGGDAINGAVIQLNNNFGAEWTIDLFRAVLTHEIGIALGLNDVDVAAGGSLPEFYDDNYDGSTSETAAATLTNSWAALIDPVNPEGTPGLATYLVNDGDPGFDSEGADIVMETQIPAALLSEPTLFNDDYAGRQFLYPVLIPEPSLSGLLALACGLILARRRRP